LQFEAIVSLANANVFYGIGVVKLQWSVVASAVPNLL